MANFDNIIQEINTNIPDNNTQAITAAKLRTTLIDLTNAIDTVQDDFQQDISDELVDLVVNNLTSTSTTNALSANQGRILNEAIDDVNHSVSDLSNRVTNLVVDNLTTEDATKALSAKQGRILASLQEKFNVTGSGNTSVRTQRFFLPANRIYRVVIGNPSISLEGVSGATNYIFYVRYEETQNIIIQTRYSDGVLQPYYEFKTSISGDYTIGMRCKSGEVQTFYLYDITDEHYNCENIKIMPDIYYQYFNNNAVATSTTETVGIKYITLKAGQIIQYHLEKPTTDSTRYNQIVNINGTKQIIDVLNPNSTTNKCFSIYKAETNCTIGFCFNYTLNNWYRIIEDFELENSSGLYLYPWNKFETSSVAYQSKGTNRYTVHFYNTNDYLTFFFKIPTNSYNISRLLFKYTNNSYDVIRVWGMKNYNFISTDISSYITYTDVLGNKYARVTSTINNGNVDTIAIVLQKQADYTEEEYADFKLENPYSELKQFNEVRTVPNLIYENNVPVGSIVNFMDQGYYAVVKDKPANNWGDGSTYKKISLIDTTNIPIEDSNAEIANVMNVISTNIGATNSNWKNTYGGKLYSIDQCYNRTTAKDMVRIMIAAIKYPVITEIMGTENANVHIYGAHDRDKNLKNNSWDKVREAYTYIHGTGSTMPYKILCMKPGATVATDSVDSQGNQGYAVGLDGISNTGFAMVGIAEINGKLIAFDAANVSSTNYTNGRLARARATVELLDECKYIIEHNGSGSSPTYTYLERGAAAEIKEFPYLNLNSTNSLEFMIDYNGDTQYQPASTSKVAGALAILSVLSNLEEYHSIWNSTKELINDSGSSESNPEGHIAYGGDVESVRTSLYAMMLVSNGANTLSLGRMAGEKIIKAKKNFIA